MTHDEYKKTVGSRITWERTEAGLTQVELAEKMNVFPSQIARWESGNHLVDLYNAYWLSKTLCVSMDTLFGN